MAFEYSKCISAECYDPPSNVYPGYDSKVSDGEALVFELLEMGSNPSLPLLPGPLLYRVVESYRILSMGQIELFDIETECRQMTV